MSLRRPEAVSAAVGSPPSPGPTERSLADLVAELAAPPAPSSAAERQLTERLQGLADRLRLNQFQLAVVGQFKRGKSSLLNALLGHEALPTGVLPLTALPTFIRAGRSFDLDVATTHGAVQRHRLTSAETLQETAAEYVAELANPANVKGVLQVSLAVPSALLDAGLVLIDTPGIGSAAQHNTQAAEAALPECDAALMVLSPEPPITEAELAYLAKIRRNAARVLVACNKVDAAEGADVDTIVGYLRDVLSTAGLPEAEIFRVSARQALAALRDDDQPALAKSGVPALRARLMSMARSESRHILGEAVGLKAGALGRALIFENDLMLAALAAPLEALERQAAAFDRAKAAFDQERQRASDQLDGDRRRLLQMLDADADRETRALADRLKAGLDQGAVTKPDPREVWNRRRAALPQALDTLQSEFVRRNREALEAALAAHQARADALLEDLRRVAADLLCVPYEAPAPEAAFSLRAQAYWVDRPRESLADGPVGLIERLAPGGLGRRFALRRIHAEIDQIAAANIEHMRWACRQNLEDALRRFGGDLSRALTAAAASIADGLAAAARMQTQGAGATAQAVFERTVRRRRLDTLVETLDRLSTPADTAPG